MNGENGVSIPGLKTLSISTSASSYLNSRSSRWDSSYPLESVHFATTLESNSSLISTVPCWLGVMETPDK